MTQPLYRLVWPHPVTGAACRGEPMSKAAAEAWLANARRNTPDVAYAIEAVAEIRAAA